MSSDREQSDTADFDNQEERASVGDPLKELAALAGELLAQARYVLVCKREQFAAKVFETALLAGLGLFSAAIAVALLFAGAFATVFGVAGLLEQSFGVSLALALVICGVGLLAVFVFATVVGVFLLRRSRLKQAMRRHQSARPESLATNSDVAAAQESLH